MSYSSENSFNQILNRCLNDPLLTDKDRRPGSIIYDTVAPICLELAEAYIRMDILESQTYLMTAVGNSLDKKADDYGVTREPATQAQMQAKFYTYEKDSNGQIIYYDDEDNVTTKAEGGEPHLIEMDVPIGSRFIFANDNSLVYEYIEDVTQDNQTIKVVRCETYGTKGNLIGLIIPMSPINNLIEARIVSSYISAQDVEEDDVFRQRIKDTILTQGYGGNIDDYRTKVNAIQGVAQCKVFPVWIGGGTVLISVVEDRGDTFYPIDDTFKNEIQQLIDPIGDDRGMGVGIAPIGHTVTITTPVEDTVDVTVYIELDSNYTVNSVRSQIEEKINEYFNEERRKFNQDWNLHIYQSEVSARVLSVEGVINVTSVFLNNANVDIIYQDTATENGQYLPKVGIITPLETT